MHTNPEVLALLALGEASATPAELDHVASCDICTREVAELSHLAGVGRAVQGAAPLDSPRPEVWERIRAEIGFGVESGAGGASTPSASTETSGADLNGRLRPGGRSDRAQSDHAQSDQRTPSPAAISSSPAPRRAAPRGRRILALALAAAIALIVGVGIGLGWSALSRPSPTVVAQAELAPAAPAWDGSTGEALLELDASGKEILVVRLSTPRPVNGELVVWAMNATATAMQPVGRLTGAEGEWSVSRDLVARFPVIDVSEEPLDGDPTHSGKSIVRGTLNV